MKLAGRKRASFEEFATAHGAGLIRLAFMVSGDRGRAEDDSPASTRPMTSRRRCCSAMHS
jgi:hypothetical protein